MNQPAKTTEKNAVLLLVRTLSGQGEKILGARWLPFIDFLRGQLGG